MEINIPDFDVEVVLDENDELTKEKSTDVAAESNADGDESVTYENGDEMAVAVFNTLKEKGVFTESQDNPFNGTWEKLDEYFQSIPQMVLNTIVEEAPEVIKKVFEFAFADDVNNLTKEDLAKFTKTYLEELDSNTEFETMDDAREYLEKLYTERGMRKSAITAALNALEDDDELMDEAKTERSKTSTTRKTDQMIEEREEQRVQREQANIEFAKQLTQELSSTGWKDTRINAVKEVLQSNKINQILNEVAGNPKALVKLTDFLTYYDPKNKDFNYSAFMKQSEGVATSTLKQNFDKAINSNSPTITTKSSLKNPNPLPENEVPIVD